MKKRKKKKKLVLYSTHRLHLRTITIIIAPNIADITETIINVKAHPSSPAASVTRKTKTKNVYDYYEFVIRRIYIEYVSKIIWIIFKFDRQFLFDQMPVNA